MVDIKDVPGWVTIKGIGHAIAQTGGPGLYTLCRSLHIGWYPKVKRLAPKRICSKCREALKTATIDPSKMATT